MAKQKIGKTSLYYDNTGWEDVDKSRTYIKKEEVPEFDRATEGEKYLARALVESLPKDEQVQGFVPEAKTLYNRIAGRARSGGRPTKLFGKAK